MCESVVVVEEAWPHIHPLRVSVIVGVYDVAPCTVDIRDTCNGYIPY